MGARVILSLALGPSGMPSPAVPVVLTGSLLGCSATLSILLRLTLMSNRLAVLRLEMPVHKSGVCLMFRVSSRKRVYAPSSDEMITKQSYKKECDINNILNQFKKTGIISHMSSVKPTYVDLPDVSDYQQSLALMMQAEEAFDALPSVVRRYFENDPARLLEALGDPSQRSKLEELGILNPKPEPRPAVKPASILPDQNPPTLDPA